jgi:hypothetical protein
MCADNDPSCIRSVIDPVPASVLKMLSEEHARDLLRKQRANATRTTTTTSSSSSSGNSNSNSNGHLTDPISQIPNDGDDDFEVTHERKVNRRSSLGGGNGVTADPDDLVFDQQRVPGILSCCNITIPLSSCLLASTRLVDNCNCRVIL